jgi:hypothetical protein
MIASHGKVVSEQEIGIRLDKYAQVQVFSHTGRGRRRCWYLVD